MNSTKMIQKAIGEIIGGKLELITKDYLEGSLPDKALFCKMIDSWSSAWEMQAEIFNKYQIDFSNYDDNLYYALEKSMLLLYGELKTKLILGYLYNKNNEAIYLENKELPHLQNSAELYEYILLLDEENDNNDLTLDFNLDKDDE